MLPTVERVAEMMKHTSRKADEVVGHHTATHFREVWQCTVEQVAVNAVMAGARPDYFPVILALAATGASARGSSTSSMASMAVVNGPIRNEIGMNAGTGAMGPYNHANATIGRAFGLLSQNLQGGSVPGDTYMGSMGNALAYASPTFAENEERSPFEPLHVSRGYRADQSVVSAFVGLRHMAFTLGLRPGHWREQVRNMLRGMDPNESPTLLLDPIAARLFQDVGGLKTKQELIDWISENARMPAGEYWDYQLVQNYLYPRATFGEEPLAGKLRAAPDEMIRMWTPDQVNVVVVGGETNGYWRIAGARHARQCLRRRLAVRWKRSRVCASPESRHSRSSGGRRIRRPPAAASCASGATTGAAAWARSRRCRAVSSRSRSSSTTSARRSSAPTRSIMR